MMNSEPTKAMTVSLGNDEEAMTLADDEAMKTMTIGEVKRRITLTDD